MFVAAITEVFVGARYLSGDYQWVNGAIGTPSTLITDMEPGICVYLKEFMFAYFFYRVDCDTDPKQAYICEK